MSNKLRIIGGEWRSRQIGFDDAPGLRPTPGRVRETLFNWLQAEVANSRCLDLYAGSGALGFEAASRGANSIVQVENNAKTCQKLRENCRLLGANQIQVVQQDVNQYLMLGGDQFDLVFLDPPFGLNMIQETSRLLNQAGWLASFAKIYIEAERGLVLSDMPSTWNVLKQKTAGDVAYYLFQKTDAN
ncbi:MAG: 16S rRNA (guanine(966)-N(2))-methyltransferase RsmD [Methylomonas sp.]